MVTMNGYLVSTVGIPVTAEGNQGSLVKNGRTLGGFTICTGTFGSGATIGMIPSLLINDLRKEKQEEVRAIRGGGWSSSTR